MFKKIDISKIVRVNIFLLVVLTNFVGKKTKLKKKFGAKKRQAVLPSKKSHTLSLSTTHQTQKQKADPKLHFTLPRSFILTSFQLPTIFHGGNFNITRFSTLHWPPSPSLPQARSSHFSISLFHQPFLRCHSSQSSFVHLLPQTLPYRYRHGWLWQGPPTSFFPLFCVIPISNLFFFLIYILLIFFLLCLWFQFFVGGNWKCVSIILTLFFTYWIQILIV